MGPDLLLVAGTPASGKSRFGAWLEENHHYAHVDWESEGSRGKWELEEAWRKYVERIVRGYKGRENPELVGEDCGKIIAGTLIGRWNRVVLDWGFRPILWTAARHLKNRGFSLWWFDADTDLARSVFIKRELEIKESPQSRFQKRLGEFEKQVKYIDEWRPVIHDLFRPNIIQAIGMDGVPALPADIYSEICARSG